MTVVEQMLQRYALNTHEDRSYALREVMQEIALAGLNRAGFFASQLSPISRPCRQSLQRLVLKWKLRQSRKQPQQLLLRLF